MSSKPYSENQLRKYPIKLNTIPKLMFDDPLVDTYITSNVRTCEAIWYYLSEPRNDFKIADYWIHFQEPVVIRGCDLVASANNSWNMDYLETNMTGKYTVILSSNHKFKYHDEKKTQACPNFTPNTRRVQMKFSEFSERIKSWKKNEERLVEVMKDDNV